MKKCYQHQRRVEFRDTDAAGIVHFSVFFNYMEEAEHALLRQLGLDVVIRDEDGIISFPRVSASCDYQAPVTFGDIVSIDVLIENIGQSSVTYKFGFKIDEKEVAIGKVTTVCCRMAADKHPQTLAIPESIRQPLQSYWS